MVAMAVFGGDVTCSFVEEDTEIPELDDEPEELR